MEILASARPNGLRGMLALEESCTICLDRSSKSTFFDAVAESGCWMSEESANYDGGYITSPTTYDESTLVVKKRSQEATSCATLGTP